MDKGFMAGNMVIWWTKEPPKFAITKRGGNIQIARSYTGWAFVDAYRGENCKITITPDKSL